MDERLKKNLEKLKQKFSKSKKLKVLKSEAVIHNTISFVALEPDIVDYNGDIISKDEIIKVAHNFMINLQDKVVNVNHQTWTDLSKTEAMFVESYILPVDVDFWTDIVHAGSWIVAIKFSDEMYQKVIDGDYVGISIEWEYYKQLIS